MTAQNDAKEGRLLDYDYHMNKAIGLLALAMVARESNGAKKAEQT